VLPIAQRERKIQMLLDVRPQDSPVRRFQVADTLYQLTSPSHGCEVHLP
jgi:hypothetical protein